MRSFTMLKFLSGLGKEKSGDADDGAANLLDDIQLEEFDIDGKKIKIEVADEVYYFVHFGLN